MERIELARLLGADKSAGIVANGLFVVNMKWSWICLDNFFYFRFGERKFFFCHYSVPLFN